MTDEIAKASGRVGTFESERLRFRIVLLVLGHRYWSWIPLLAVFTALIVAAANWLNNYLDDAEQLTTLAIDWLPVVVIGIAFVIMVRRLHGHLASTCLQAIVPPDIVLSYTVPD